MPTENENVMNQPEKKRKRREWVKTAAIIFLAVMLVLTFFSNTIMNMSLPEVSGQYAGWGEISTGIRGSGTIEANMAYNITLDSTRTIKTIAVKRGDHVEAGQVLFTLDDSDSEELKQAKELLESLQYDYSVKLIQTLPTDYAQTNKNIANMREDLEKARKEKESIKTNEEALKSAKAATAAAQKDVDDLNDMIDELQTAIAEIQSGEAAGNSTIAMLLANLAKAKTDLTAAQTQLEIASSEVEYLRSQLTGVDDSALESLRRQIEETQRELNYLKEDWDALVEAEAAEEEITNARRAYERKEAELRNLQADYDAALASYNASASQQAALDAAITKENNAKAQVSACEQNIASIQGRLDQETTALTSGLKAQLDTVKSNLKIANANLKAAQEAQAEAESKATMTVEQADENIQSLQRQLESMIIDFQSQQKADGVNSKLNSLELEKARKDIAEQQKVVDSLSGKGADSEVKTKFAGTVTDIFHISGDTVPAGDAFAAIDVEGKGYTLNIPVTNEQSRQVQVGDIAKVSDYWYGNLEITLAAIKTDQSNPGKGKILEFSVVGNAEVGQNLTVTVGSRKTSYEVVVPNSAVHEDTNGTFILIAQPKSTPLGNRYIATRVDAKVIAKDNVNTAIDTDSKYGYDYVITTATKPVEAGTQVRLVENG